jgi:prepilin-type N-terminal cleavage/methylation domain-containing protein
MKKTVLPENSLNKAFTLVELTATMAIVAILSGVSVATYFAISKANLDKAALDDTARIDDAFSEDYLTAFNQNRKEMVAGETGATTVSSVRPDVFLSDYIVHGYNDADGDGKVDELGNADYPYVGKATRMNYALKIDAAGAGTAYLYAAYDSGRVTASAFSVENSVIQYVNKPTLRKCYKSLSEALADTYYSGEAYDAEKDGTKVLAIGYVPVFDKEDPGKVVSYHVGKRMIQVKVTKRNGLSNTADITGVDTFGMEKNDLLPDKYSPIYTTVSIQGTLTGKVYHEAYLFDRNHNEISSSSHIFDFDPSYEESQYSYDASTGLVYVPVSESSSAYDYTDLTYVRLTDGEANLTKFPVCLVWDHVEHHYAQDTSWSWFSYHWETTTVKTVRKLYTDELTDAVRLQADTLRDTATHTSTGDWNASATRGATRSKYDAYNENFHLSLGSVTVKENVTLPDWLPTVVSKTKDESLTVCDFTTDPSSKTSAETAPEAGSGETAKMLENVHMVINPGVTLTVPSAAAFVIDAYTHFGAYHFFDLRESSLGQNALGNYATVENNGTIDLESKSSLLVRGILSGKGVTFAKSGSLVRERATVLDYLGAQNAVYNVWNEAVAAENESSDHFHLSNNGNTFTPLSSGVGKGFGHLYSINLDVNWDQISNVGFQKKQYYTDFKTGATPISSKVLPDSIRSEVIFAKDASYYVDTATRTTPSDPLTSTDTVPYQYGTTLVLGSSSRDGTLASYLTVGENASFTKSMKDGRASYRISGSDGVFDSVPKLYYVNDAYVPCQFGKGQGTIGMVFNFDLNLNPAAVPLPLYDADIAVSSGSKLSLTSGNSYELLPSSTLSVENLGTLQVLNGTKIAALSQSDFASVTDGIRNNESSILSGNLNTDNAALVNPYSEALSAYTFSETPASVTLAEGSSLLDTDSDGQCTIGFMGLFNGTEVSNPDFIFSPSFNSTFTNESHGLYTRSAFFGVEADRYGYLPLIRLSATDDDLTFDQYKSDHGF